MFGWEKTNGRGHRQGRTGALCHPWQGEDSVSQTDYATWKRWRVGLFSSRLVIS